MLDPLILGRKRAGLFEMEVPRNPLGAPLGCGLPLLSDSVGDEELGWDVRVWKPSNRRIKELPPPAGEQVF